MAVVKPLVITGVVLAVLGGGAAVGDTFVRGQAEQRVADAIQDSFALEATPEVTLGGLPFSAVFVTHKVPDASLVAADVPVEISGQAVSLVSLRATATDIVWSGTTVDVGSVQGEAILPYAALSELAQVPVEPGDDGRIQVTYTPELFGGQPTAVVTAVPVFDADNQQISLTEPVIDVSGVPPLSDEVAQAIMESVVQPIPLDLPDNLTLESLHAEGSGLRLAGIASDVRYRLE